MRKPISEIRDGKRVIIKKPELLIPAGNLDKLKIAARYGADAIFIGGQEFGLRSNAQNFTLDEIREGVEFADRYGARVYITTNIIAHNENIDGLEDYLKALGDIGVYGIIVADPLVIEVCKKVAPNVEIHLSTQQSTMNYLAVKFWQDEGLHRIVLARETTKEEIKEIMEKTDVEIEAFVHGAMCIAYSGRCTLSTHMTARDSNRGGCCQSCRWEYDLVNEGEKVFSSNDVKFSMSPKDLNLLRSVPEMIELGIDSLKVEGRMKSIHYVATVTSVYRKLIDIYCEDPDNFVMDEALMTDLAKCANRATASAFFEGIPASDEQMYDNRDEHPTQDFIGLVLEYDQLTKIATIEQRNHFKSGQRIEFFGPKIVTQTHIVGEMKNDKDELIDVARHPKMIVKMHIPFEVHPFDMMRKV